jgi:hypothetical protein
VSKDGGVGKGGLDLSFFSWLGSMFLSFSFISAIVFVSSFLYLKAANK